MERKVPANVLATVGYNIPGPRLRDDILQMLKVLQTTKYHDSFRRYDRPPKPLKSSLIIPLADLLRLVAGEVSW
jgi:hypothetical protein